MRRPDMPTTPLEKGHGLADLKGHDPLGRRIEVEKQERYAQELRNQIGSSPGLPPVSVPSPRSSLCNTPPHPSGGGQRPPPASGWRASSADRQQMGDAADKIAQLQELMRDRLHAVAEQQRMDSERLQGLIEERLAGAKGADAQQLAEMNFAVEEQRSHFKHAEELSNWAADGVEVLRKELAALREDTAEGMRQMQHRANQDPRCSNEQRVAALENEVALLKANFGKLEAQSHAQFDEIHRILTQHQAFVKGQLTDLSRQIEEVQSETCQRMQELQEQLNYSVQQQVEKQIKAALSNQHDDLVRRIEDVQAEASHQVQHLHEQLSGFVQQHVDKQLGKMKNAIAKAAPVEPVSPAPPPKPAPEQVPEAFGYLRGGEDEAHVLRSKRISIGRGPTCDVRISNSQCVSNSHAAIEFSSGSGAFLQDQGSRNGTFVNDRRVPCPGGIGLQNGDTIQFGVDGPAFSFEYGAACPGQPAVSKAERGSERGRSATPPHAQPRYR